jgi:hypothetical protein
MLPDKDIYCVAHFLMHEHGCDAEHEATRAGCSIAATANNCSLASEFGGRSPCATDTLSPVALTVTPIICTLA